MLGSNIPCLTFFSEQVSQSVSQSDGGWGGRREEQDSRVEAKSELSGLSLVLNKDGL